MKLYLTKNQIFRIENKLNKLTDYTPQSILDISFNFYNSNNKRIINNQNLEKLSDDVIKQNVYKCSMLNKKKQQCKGNVLYKCKKTDQYLCWQHAYNS